MANPTIKKRNILNQAKKQKRCMMCVKQCSHADYKDLRLLSTYLSSFARILPRRYTGTCVRHQKMVTNAIKKSRLMGLLPYTIHHKQYAKGE
ncbi:MAG: 30S ribosomal protein S18 [Candidatus Gracilibacteria bacterium]|nr:30S ribosomal protein S18 [Candidatus Gracilibacteria bacterium]